MAETEINISIERHLNVPVKEKWLQGIILKTLETEDVVSLTEIGLVITGNETIRKLNRTYRDNDESTDVLAFHMMPDRNKVDEPLFVNPPDGVNYLGEVVISYPQTIEQAQQHGHGVEQELALLIIHGVLHLLGYDHELPQENQQMRAKEKEILEKLDLA